MIGIAMSTFHLLAQGISINNTNSNPDGSAMLDVQSTSKGMLIPRMSTAQRAAITSPATGLLVFDTNTRTFWFFDTTSWTELQVGTDSDNQDLSTTLVGTDRTINITGGSSTSFSVADNDNNASNEIQNLAYAGNTLSITGGNSVNISNGDITEVAAGDGLVGGATTGDATINVVATNGLTDNANDVRLGGALVQNTTITQANFGMTFNLSGSGDFNVQDNGTTHFQVLDNGNTRIGGDVEWRDENTAGTLLAQLIDDGNDGRFIIRENGVTSVDLDANTQFVFNEQGLNRDFRVESDANANMLRVDAGTNRIGIGTANPSHMLQVNTDAKINTALILGAPTAYGNHLLMLGAATNAGAKIGHTGGYNNAESGRFAFEENVDAQQNVATYCGFEWHHNGAVNELYLSSGCTANAIRMTVERGGQIGISTDNPTANLSVNGTANKTGGGTWAVFSDARLKDNVSDFKEGLDFIQQVRTVNFTYNDKMEEIWGESPATKNRVYQGVIAQELQEIAPDMVQAVVVGNEINVEDADYQGQTAELETYLEVDPNKFTYALINAVKEQQAMIDVLMAKQQRTQNELAEIKALLKEIIK